ncbi:MULTISPECIES: hypothetical protein [Streptomyces]|uniref:Sortase n=1 Tax=Streptomyces xanthii TaxID=2768069 RepID=A0A7H1BBC2_9ACTN|nr:hypothetical protein [Streptomyces xanthii]QNS06027.1 hypothetical protein IAG42_22220 [Streptomyces xanthii]
MRTGLLALRAAGAAAVLVTIPAAAAHGAQDGGSVTVSPQAAPPGTDVELAVTGCAGTAGRAVSDAFVSAAVLAPAADRSALTAEARVASSAKPGAHEITVTCDGVETKTKGTVRVLERGASPAPTPTAAVHAGGGGAAARLAAAEQAAEGPGTRHAVIGLVLAAIAAVAVACRSVRRRRNPSEGPR